GKAQSIDAVMRCSLGLSNARARFVRGLPLAISNQPDLQAQILRQRKGLGERIVEVEVLARMNVGTLLYRMELIHLERRNGVVFAFRQIDRWSRCRYMDPITGSNVGVRSCAESAGRCQETVDGPNLSALCLPAENEGLIVRVGKSAAAAE